MAEPDDLLPDAVLTFKRDMLRTIYTLWAVYTCVIVFAWALMPWRLGWRGVGICLWLTLWWAWGPGWYTFAKWLKARLDSE